MSDEQTAAAKAELQAQTPSEPAEQLPAEPPAQAPAEPAAQISADIVGRKIFFLYPTNSIQNQIIAELAQQEYEAYLAKDHVRLFYALKKLGEGVVFVNIDEKISEPEWDKWISSVLTAIPNIKIGVFSSNNAEELRNKYIEKLKITCGFIHSKVDMSKAVEQVLEILKDLNVKGQRKFLRASVERESNVTINMPFNGEFVHGIIKDISVVGVACVFDRELNLLKNSLCKDIQIRLQSVLLNVDAVVFGSRLIDNEKIYVLLFTQRADTQERSKIRKYIQQVLQSKMDPEIN